MSRLPPDNFDHLWSSDRNLQNKAFFEIVDLTEAPVDWAYKVWDAVVENLTHKDNHNRAIAAQLLSNLAKSDPEKRILADFEALLAVTRNERFVTARHSLQALWKVGTVGKDQKQLVLEGLEQRYMESAKEKNCTLIRYDIVQDLKNLYDSTQDEAVKAKAFELIAREDDLKYRKKYSKVW